MRNNTEETPQAFAAYCDYCALGAGRSLDSLAQERVKSGSKASHRLATLKEWSARYNWQERVKTYDEERANERAAKRELDIERMNERHAAIGTTQQSRALTILEKLANAGEIDARTATTLLKLATDLERAARGAIDVRETTISATSGIVVYLPDNGR